jgi:hypothetical protein
VNAIIGSFHFSAPLDESSAAVPAISSGVGEQKLSTDVVKLLTRLLVHARKRPATPAASTPSSAVAEVIAEPEDAVVLADDVIEPAVPAETTSGKRAKKAGNAATSTKKRNSTEVELSALSTSHLLALLCLLSYASSVSDTSASRMQDYLLKFDAGTQLVYAASDGACQCEKEPFRQYPFAVLLYEWLLQLPFLPHRRGAWYKRLCIDYAHLQLPRCALRACYRCLADPHVNVSTAQLSPKLHRRPCDLIIALLMCYIWQVSDKTDLAQRATALKVKLHKHAALAAALAFRRIYGRKQPTHLSAEVTTETGCYSVAQDFTTALQSVAAVPDAIETSVNTASVKIEAPVTKNSRTKRRKVKHEAVVDALLEFQCDDELRPPAPLVDTAGDVSQDLTYVPATARAEECEVLRVLYLVNTLPLTREPTAGDATSTVFEVLQSVLLRTIVSEVDEAAALAYIAECNAKVPVAETTKAARPPPVQNTGKGWEAAGFIKRAATLSGSNVSTGHNAVKTAPSAAKRAQSTSITGMGSTETWTCVVCTYVNPASQTFACTVCMHSKPAAGKSHITTTLSVGSAVKKASKVGAANPAPFKPAVAVQESKPKSIFANLDSVIVDLLSDSDNDGSAGAAAMHMPVTTSATTVSAATARSEARNAAPPVCRADNTTGGSEKPAETGSELELLYVLKQQVEGKLTHLTVAARPSADRKGSGDNRPVADLHSALNLPVTLQSTGDEESTDLALLGLLTPEQAALNALERLSLENVIPAPPFFVVHGKRIGDPSRKGKSQFCGECCLLCCLRCCSLCGAQAC